MWGLHLPRIGGAVALVAAIVTACAPPTPDPQEGGGTGDLNLPPRTSTGEPADTTQQANTSPRKNTSTDPADAGSTADAADAAPKLPYASPCTTGAQCAGGLCLEFDDKLLCTQACQKDDDCPNNDDCDDNVCEADD